MFYIISMLILTMASFVLFRISKTFSKSEDKEQKSVGLGLRIVAFVAIAIMVIGTIVSSYYQIPAGSVGIVYEFGSITSQLGEGLQSTWPWRTVTQANIQIQSHKFQKLTSFSIETQEVYVDATLNIRVSVTAVQTLYRTVGKNWFEVIVQPRVAQNFKDETVKYKSVDIAPSRENVRKDVSARLEKELSPYSIEVVDLLLDNIDFNTGFKDAIEAKQKATQNALEEEQKVLVERHKAEQQVETAKGQGQSILEVAQKQAEANTKLNSSLTPTLVQYTLVQKLGSQIQVMILPAGQSFILDPKALLSKPTGSLDNPLGNFLAGADTIQKDR